MNRNKEEPGEGKTQRTGGRQIGEKCKRKTLKKQGCVKLQGVRILQMKIVYTNKLMR